MSLSLLRFWSMSLLDIEFLLDSIFFQHFEYFIPFPLTMRNDEKPAVTLSGNPLYINCFSLGHLRFSVFGLRQFNYDGYRFGFFCICLTWNLLSFLDICIHVFHQIGMIPAAIFWNILSVHFSFSSPSWDCHCA